MKHYLIAFCLCFGLMALSCTDDEASFVNATNASDSLGQDIDSVAYPSDTIYIPADTTWVATDSIYFPGDTISIPGDTILISRKIALTK